jgi:hypothetical protein
MPEDRRRPTKRRRLLTWSFSAAVHLLVLGAVVTAQPPPERLVEDAPMLVQLYTPPPPPPPPEPPKDPAPVKKAEPAPPAPKSPKRVKPDKPPPPRRIKVRKAALAPPDVRPLVAVAGPTADGASEVSESELGGAATAGSGRGGGGASCDMIRRLQVALRKDRLVQSAVAQAHRGQAIRVWNGDWVRHGEQEGAGLAAVREAISWEVGFAPEACRHESMRGLVLISLNDSPGAARLVLGHGQWRWSDLLFSKGGRRASVAQP